MAPASPSTDESVLDRTFRSLAAGGRRSIVARLAQGPAAVTELAEPLEMSLPAVLQHIEVLQRDGLVHSEKTGRVRTCRLEPTRLRVVEQWIAGNRLAWEQRLDRLDDILDSIHQEGR